MASAPHVGDPAPDFTVEGTDGTFRLSDHRGERVVLLFYPGDETMVCTKQFCSYRDRAGDMSALEATVVGISDQSLESHEAFVVARAYGVSAPIIGTRRAAFVIDEDGIVRHRHVHTLGLDFQDVDDLAAALDALPARA